MAEKPDNAPAPRPTEGGSYLVEGRRKPRRVEFTAPGSAEGEEAPAPPAAEAPAEGGADGEA
jgi:hypothetical protein